MREDAAGHSQTCGTADAARGTFDLLMLLATREPVAPSIVLSPACLSTAFAVLGLAEDAKCRGLIADQFGDVGHARAVAHATAVTVTAASSIWLSGFGADHPDLLAAFLHDAKTIAGASVHTDVTLENVNAWVKEATKGLVPTILSEIDADTTMLIVSALVFDASWAVQFDPLLTEDAPFHSPAGDVACRMMYRGGEELSILRDSGFYGVKLDLQTPESREGYSLAVVVVARDDGQCPSASQFHQVASGTHAMEANLYLPITYASFGPSNVAPELCAAGLKPLTQTGHMAADPRTSLSRVVHRALLKLDEKGAKGAAVAAVVCVTECVHEAPPTLRFDRPFGLTVVAYRGENPVATLFAAFITDPSKDRW
ncbi:MAG: serpin family protein [Dehalococcoidia bacterium]|jgi:serpin B|nr:serpin family protein [Dehalococcoidia bacterium]